MSSDKTYLKSKCDVDKVEEMNGEKVEEKFSASLG